MPQQRQKRHVIDSPNYCTSLLNYFSTLHQERREAEKWQDGAKSSKSKEEKEEKRQAEIARKAEAARLLAEEEASLPAKPKTAPKAAAKKAAAKNVKSAGPGAIAAGGLDVIAGGEKAKDEKPEDPETFAATGIDNALDLLEVVTAKMDKASVGQQAAGLERHPERRFKAALEAYKEREMPNVRAEVRSIRETLVF
ncbi:hypothetical protein AcW2_004041 [Taiwanofungus camphoratus]|nr:hypothetical protein AcW2_004041 [Antrodia cinnamomea]